MVHNLGKMSLKGKDFNETYGCDWAIEANELLKRWINSKDHYALINYKTSGGSIKLAEPTPEHYLPLLYTLALQDEKDAIGFFNDDAIGGSISITGVRMSWCADSPKDLP